MSALGTFFKKVKKWQPLKTVEKVAQFVPGGAAISDRVKEGIEVFKRRRESGQSPGDAFAAGAGVHTTTTEQQAKNMGMIVAVGVGVLVLILLMRRR